MRTIRTHPLRSAKGSIDPGISISLKTTQSRFQDAEGGSSPYLRLPLDHSVATGAQVIRYGHPREDARDMPTGAIRAANTKKLSSIGTVKDQMSLACALSIIMSTADQYRIQAARLAAQARD